MKKKPKRLKSAEEKVKSAASASVAAMKKVGNKARVLAVEGNEKYRISQHAKALVKKTEKKLSDLNERHELTEKAKSMTTFVEGKARKIKTTANESGLTKRVKKTARTVDEKIIEPAKKLAEKTGVAAKITKAADVAANQYGKARTWMKPYFAPETPDELLRTTKRELIYINACILQISRGEAERLASRLGSAIVAKIAGVASVGTLLGMVSTFGTASTGTAIAALHGAAATNATLFWVGSLLGGGVATGAALTGGLALAVGYGVYKFISSDARKYEELTDNERHIVDATGFLIAAINDVLEDPKKGLNLDEADLLLQNTLKPLHRSLLDQSDEICQNLDIKNRLAFRQHALLDFEHSVIYGFEFFIQEQKESRRRYPEYVVAGVIYALLTRSAVDDSRESQLALSAIRRMKTAWNDASEAQLSEELSEYDPEQIRGLANNAKGIYHELLFVDNYNQAHEDTYAEIFEATNHPGADVRIKATDTDEVVKELQLKATSSETLVKEHLEKYPDIDVWATSEIAQESGLADSTGISNPEITKHIDDALGDIADNTLLDRTSEAAGYAVLVAAGREAIEVLRGKRKVNDAARNAAIATSVAATSTALVAYLFG